MNYEKEYKEALERASKYYNANTNKGYREIFEDIFHEFKESEDERIRKELIERFKWELKGAEEQDAAGCNRQKDIAMFKRGLAWLEKQGEQKFIEQDTEVNDLWVYIREWNDKFGRLPKDEDELVSCIDYVMKRQKPADKVEPKFEVGDWVVHDMSDGRKVIRQVVNMTNKSYVLDGEGFNTFYFNDLENDFHLWSIEDAKDGDVIFYDSGWTCIFKNIHGIWYSSYCFITADGEFYTGYERHAVDAKLNGNANLATKEQRDLLFQKMHEAGYEWDAEKKELTKIEHNPADSYCQENCKGFKETGKCFADGDCKAKRDAEQNPFWSEGDENVINHLLAICAGAKRYRQFAGCLQDDITKYQNWLKSLKDRVQPQPKQDLSEEDKKMKSLIISTLTSMGTLNLERYYHMNLDEVKNWLKSIKPRWKPSEEQMQALNWIAYNYALMDKGTEEKLQSLYNDLKNL